MSFERVTTPEALKALSPAEVDELIAELRREIVSTVTVCGGHLASNLGVVELTVALHRVFDCPRDQIVFDVGHQCYTHKLLTDRRARFQTLRAFGGIGGFPNRDESPCDAFGTGHASTSISAALGLARARDIRGESGHVIAVVGDGALTGGMCYEALNDAGNTKTRLIIVLNDNNMSISRNVGALSMYLTHLRASKGWMSAKRAVARSLPRVPLIGKPLFKLFQRVKNSLRNSFVSDRFFSTLGFRYLGPIDGQDEPGLERMLRAAKRHDEPVLIHVSTQKGYGDHEAEAEPETYHGITRAGLKAAPSYGTLAGRKLMSLAARDPGVVVVTAAMTRNTGFSPFQKTFPDRLFDVGIAEEHAVTLAAGMAAGGLKPYVAIYDTFLQRGYDQIVHDVCRQNLPVRFLMDRAGLSGEDGATHHGVFGLAYLRHIPNMTLLEPCDARELDEMLDWSLAAERPVAIRYPRASRAMQTGAPPFAPGVWNTLREGGDAAMLCVGAMARTALDAADRLAEHGVSLRVYNCSSIKPMDERALREAAALPFYTLEEHAVQCGFGSAVCERCAELSLPAPRALFGLPDAFTPHGDHASLLASVGLSTEAVANRVLETLSGGEPS